MSRSEGLCRELIQGQEGRGVSLLEVLWRALGGGDQPEPQPAIAQITIISTEPVKQPGESRSPQARG
jgi:hypothetical protein